MKTLTIDRYSELVHADDDHIIITAAQSNGITPAWQLTIERDFAADLVNEIVRALAGDPQ